MLNYQPMDKNVTVAQIAKACGVAVMTVSRALRSHPRVAPATRERILLTAQRLGYHPGNGAQGRPRHPTAERPLTVNLVMGLRPRSAFHYGLLMSIVEELARTHYNCVVRTCTDDYPQFLALCDALLADPGAGMLIVGYLPLAQLQSLLRLPTEIVLGDHPGDASLEGSYAAVGFDNVEIARLAIRHLVAMGRRRILMVKGFAAHYFSQAMERGYREVIEEAGLEFDKTMILEGDFTADGACTAVTAALGRKLRFDAVFSNDEMACGVVRALHTHNLRVPQDVAVAGCDGLPVGLCLTPALTTVPLDCQQLGKVAVECLLRKPGAQPRPYRIQLMPRLEIRESTAGQVPTEKGKRSSGEPAVIQAPG